MDGRQSASSWCCSGVLHGIFTFAAADHAGLVFGAKVAQNHIVAQVQGLVGEEGARAIQAMIGMRASRHQESSPAW